MNGRRVRLPVLLILALLTAAPSARPQDRFDAWVAFRDKGMASPAAREAALAELARAFDPRALERRKLRRTRPGLFDQHDLPLAAGYLEAVAAAGAELRVQSRWLNGVTVLATRGQLAAIEELPFVRQVGDVRLHVPKGARRSRVPFDPDLRSAPENGADEVYGRSGPQIRQLGLDRLHRAGFTGAGVRVAVIDTGFFLDHAAFNGPQGSVAIVAQWDFVDNDPVTAPEPGDYPDQHEHGSLVLGPLAADRPGTLVGSAPESDFILLKAEDAAEEYFLEEKWFAAALEYAEAHGADVVSSSLVLYEGYEASQLDGRTSVMARAWDLAVGNGIIGLQGVGNAGHDQDPTTHRLLTPADAPGVITVGSVDADGEIARFSSDGGKIAGAVRPELLARGRRTASISPYAPSAYTQPTGASVATPLLAGAVACLVQARPTWTVEEVRAALVRSASYFREHGTPDPLFIRGYGIPDVARAADLERSAR